MEVVCTILAGGNREHLIGGAINSCRKHVDHYLIIDTGPSAEEAISLARQMLRMDCTVVKYPGEFDCATARNFCLQIAAQHGFDWALILDTDERLQCDPREFRLILEQTAADIVLISDDLLTYKKDKVFRLPARGYWDGPVHEGFVYTGGGEVTIMLNARFHEMPKPEQESASLLNFVERQCEQAIKDYPDNPRWHYYLGDCLSQRGLHQQAHEEFLLSSQLSKWDEESTWSRYRAAVELYHLGKFGEAIELHGKEVKIPEQALHAAMCAAATQRFDLAIQLAERAIKMGEAQREVPRLIFAQPETWYEAPHELLRIVYLETGNPQKAIDEDRLANELRAQRLAA